VKKTEAVSVTKISLFDDQREEFGPDSYREAEQIRFLAFYPSAAATRYIGLVTFPSCREKVTARPAGGQG
jgi:hypothetical protein